MRVLFVSNFYPPAELGGLEQNCRQVVERLRTRGHDCCVLTSRYGPGRWPPAETGVERSLYLQADVDYYKPLDFFVRRPGQEAANGRVLRDTLDTFRPDVTFIWGMWNLSPRVAYWAEQGAPGRVAYMIAGYWPIEPDVHAAYWHQSAGHIWAKPLWWPVRQLALWMLAREREQYQLKLAEVACVSKFVLDKLNEAGALSGDGRVIYNGIDPGPFLEAAKLRTPQPDQLRLIYTGSLVTHKGVLTAIEALGLLKQQGQVGGIRLTVVGGGHPDYEVQLEERVRELGLHSRVTFQGRLPRHEIPAVLAQHDVFLFTSVYEEPIARSVMEAMAVGLATIGTPVGGQREMLEDDVNALVYPPGDAAELAARILNLHHDPVLRNRLAEAGQRTVRAHFTLERMVDEIEAWLETVVR